VRDVRSVWDLTLDEIEELRSRRHLNSYVHAGLLAPLSAWPKTRCRIIPGLYPPTLEAAANRVLDAVPRLGRSSSDEERSHLRIQVTRRLHELYASLPELGPQDVPPVMRLLASLAFVVLQAEREDGMALWLSPPVRPLDPLRKRLFSLLLEPLALEDALPYWRDELERGNVAIDQPKLQVFALSMRLVQPILVLLENGVLHELAARAFANVERAMVDFERRHGLGQRPGMLLNVQRTDQLRYRNTVYLYGGNLLQRMRRPHEARAWYLRDIDSPDLPGAMRGALTSFKTCERLLSACEITPEAERSSLVALIHRSLAAALKLTCTSARELIERIDRHPEADLRPAWIELGGQRRLFGSEACREPLLAALLYQKMVRRVAYADTDYSHLETTE
jgi:hypothetical protein